MDSHELEDCENATKPKPSGRGRLSLRISAEAEGGLPVGANAKTRSVTEPMHPSTPPRSATPKRHSPHLSSGRATTKKVALFSAPLYSLFLL